MPAITAIVILLDDDLPHRDVLLLRPAGTGRVPALRGVGLRDPRPAERAFCGICAKELRDDLEEAKFVQELKRPGEDRGIFVRRESVFEGIADSIASYVSRVLGERRVKSTFARRSHAGIAEWRRRAGITTRGSGG